MRPYVIWRVRRESRIVEAVLPPGGSTPSRVHARLSRVRCRTGNGSVLSGLESLIVVPSTVGKRGQDKVGIGMNASESLLNHRYDERFEIVLTQSDRDQAFGLRTCSPHSPGGEEYATSPVDRRHPARRFFAMRNTVNPTGGRPVSSDTRRLETLQGNSMRLAGKGCRSKRKPPDRKATGNAPAITGWIGVRTLRRPERVLTCDGWSAHSSLL